MSYLRTPEHRKAQSERIRTWRPWEQSTGPTSAAGKAVVARNAWKGGQRPMLRELAGALSEQRQSLDREWPVWS